MERKNLKYKWFKSKPKLNEQGILLSKTASQKKKAQINSNMSFECRNFKG